MTFLRSFWRQKKVRQADLTEVQFTLNSDSSISGIDEFFIKSVVKNGVGSHTITFQEIAFQDITPAFLQPLAAGIGQISAVTEDSITVETQDLTGAAADISCSVGVVWHYNNFVR